MSETDDYDRKEKVVQTEKRFSVSIKQTRGTDTRDEDTVSMDWKMEQKPPRAALEDLSGDVLAVMDALRGHDDDDG